MHTRMQSNYTNTKQKAWFRRLLPPPGPQKEWAYSTPIDTRRRGEGTN